MPTLLSTFHKKARSLDARPDRYDVRDRKYQPRLVNLPFCHPKPGVVKKMLPHYQPLVLDQRSEGACTGFGLAAMINFLRFKDGFLSAGVGAPKKPHLPEKVSPRMLYEHARLYDEWAGEDYEGSSCRGAMKGWHRHGVCQEKTWPYLKGGKPGTPAAQWQVEAAEITLGAYYRVETDDLTAIQSAIFEVGAVFVSADVHGGWDVAANKNDLPLIAWKAGVRISGGHAFALVGFTSEGFIVQNSWAATWGYHGFALLTYEDWLANATDAWVAALGVPRPKQAVPTNFSSQAFNIVAGAASLARGPAGSAGAGASPLVWSEDEARSHALIVGNEGMLVRSSAAHDDLSFVNNALMGRVRDWMTKAKGNRRVAIYAHGGLNSEESGIRRVRIMGPWFEANGIFPIFVVWKTGWQESLVDMGQDVLMKLVPGEQPVGRSGGMLDWIGEKIGDGWDYTVETALGFLGVSLWRQMKQNAEASAAQRHGADILARALVDLRKDFKDANVHLLGHSAGSIWNGHFLTALGGVSGGRFDVASCHLFAAACTVPFAAEHYRPAVIKNKLPASQFWIHNLSDEAERADNVGGFYRKSLLYFVSRASEEKHKMPLLGMEAAWNPSLDKKDVFHADFASDVAKWRDFVANAGVPSPILVKARDTVNDGSKKHQPSHGGFDNDIAVITRTLNRILGRADNLALPSPIASLAGF